MIPKITQINPDSVEQYWCGKCGTELPSPDLVNGEDRILWRFCPNCGEPIQYDMAEPVQWSGQNCEKCGSSLIWKIQNYPWSYFMASSDYIGGIHLFRFKNIRIDNAYTLQYNQGRKDGDGHARRCELVNSAGLHAQGTGGRDPGRCGPHDVRSVYHAA